MSELTQEQEMAAAYGQKRQPNCVYCKHPLDEVREPQNETIVWTWDKMLKQYKKSEEGCADKPYHYCDECKDSCEAADWGIYRRKSSFFLTVTTWLGWNSS